MKNIMLFLMLFCVIGFAQQKGTFTDPRDGKKYKTVKIGDQTWMAENLNYATEKSDCYDKIWLNGAGDYELAPVAEAKTKCKKYGPIYEWHDAMLLKRGGYGGYLTLEGEKWEGGGGESRQGICPDGWHLPNNEEWKTLVNFVGNDAAHKLRAKVSDWTEGYEKLINTKKSKIANLNKMKTKASPTEKLYIEEAIYVGNSEIKIHNIQMQNLKAKLKDTYGFSALPTPGCKFDTNLPHNYGCWVNSTSALPKKPCKFFSDDPKDREGCKFNNEGEYSFVIRNDVIADVRVSNVDGSSIQFGGASNGTLSVRCVKD